jgi:S1-C subfamily serine protease
MRRLLSVSAVIAAMILPMAPASAQTPPLTPEARVQAIVEPSVVYLESHWAAYVKLPGTTSALGPFEWASRCTGFIVNPSGYIVTAGHCVDNTTEGARREAIKEALAYWIETYSPLWSEETLQSIYVNALDSAEVTGQAAGSPFEPEVFVQRGVATSGLETSEVFKARVIDFGSLSEGDVALLKIEASNLPAIELSPSSDVQVGTQVLSVGYPGSSDLVADESLTPTLKDGKINSIKTRESGSLPVYEMSAALSGGMSGGPTVDMEGRVVGLNSFKIEGETEAFNWLSPSSLITEMLSGNGASAELGETDRDYREAIQLLVAGNGKAAVPLFESVLAASPAHQKAQELLKSAKDIAATQKGFPIVLVAGIAGSLIILVGTLLFIKRRGGTAPASPAPFPPVQLEQAVSEQVQPAEHVTVQPAEAIASEATEASASVTAPTLIAGRLPKTQVETSAAEPSPNGAANGKTAGSERIAEEAVATKVATKFCGSCGAQAGASRFCGNCGQEL